MKKAQLMARADEHGVYIAATETEPAQYYKHKEITAHTPALKPRADKATAMAYKSFVYARGRFTPGGIDKYLEFRNGACKQKQERGRPYTRKPNGALQFVNSVIHLLDSGPSHGGRGNHLHKFQHVGGI